MVYFKRILMPVPIILKKENGEDTVKTMMFIISVPVITKSRFLYFKINRPYLNSLLSMFQTSMISVSKEKRVNIGTPAKRRWWPEIACLLGCTLALHI